MMLGWVVMAPFVLLVIFALRAWGQTSIWLFMLRRSF